ncbi:MAG: hypothetical protein ACYS47_17085 [Planctomycetota bacterium]|jgi:hypothetical protein
MGNRIAVPLFLAVFLFSATGVRPALGRDADSRKAYRAYQTALKRVAITESAFWKTSSKRLREAYDTFRSQWEEWYGKPDAPADIFYDLSGYRHLYGESEDLGEAKGKAAVTYAATDGVDTAKALCKQLGMVNGQILKIEKGLKTARAIQDMYHFNQEPTLRRVGHERHAALLIEALGGLRDGEAVAWLAEKGWKDACTQDKRGKGCLHRVALIDAMGRIPLDAAFLFVRNRLEAPELPLRIAALEGLARSGKARTDAVAEATLKCLAESKAFPLQITALRILETMKPPKAIGALIDLLQAEVEAKEGGVICGHILKILRAFTGKDFGLNWINWKGWFGKHKEEIESGKFKPGGKDEGKGEGGKKMNTVTFYNIPTYSKGIILIIDASDTLIIPADVDIAKKHSVFYWLESSRKKLEKYVSQMDVLKEEAKKAIEAMDRHTHFNVILLYKDDRKDACWPKPVPAVEANKRKALKMITEVKAGGWAPQYAGLLDAFKNAGLDPYAHDFDAPAADTFYLLTDGGICGGRYMTPKALVDAVKRLNRFRNVTINTVQIADLGPDAVELLRDLAHATGGSYLWRKK